MFFFWLRLLAGFPQLNFRPMYGDEGDGMLSSRLGLFYQLSDLAGYWGRWMLSPCLGLYYLLSGLCRIMGEMDAVSLSGSILPAFRPCWISVEMDAVSLSGPSNTCSRGLLQDNEGDICCSPCLGLYYQLSDLAGCRGGRLPSPCLGLLIPARGAFAG